MRENQSWTIEALTLANSLVERANSDLIEWERDGGIGVDPVTKLKTQATLAGFGLLADAMQNMALGGQCDDSLATILKDISSTTQKAAESISEAVPERTAQTPF